MQLEDSVTIPYYGKLMEVQPVTGGCAVKDNRLVVSDKISNLKFLIDTGACISVLPKFFIRDKGQLVNNSNYKLYAESTEIYSFVILEILVSIY